jgi:hypothetical protein
MFISNSSNNLENEESMIYALVEEIYQNEKKISNINQKQQNINNNPLIREITKLNQKKKEIDSNFNQNQIELESHLTNNGNQIKIKELSINSIKLKLSQLKNKLNSFNPINFQNLILSKFILENYQNDFLNNEQIETIILNSQMINENVEEISDLKNNINDFQNSSEDLFNLINKKNSKNLQINELLKMAKEEKIIIKEEIINLISQKESLEEILNVSINNLNFSNNDIKFKKIKIYSYELYNLDSNKIANNISEDIIEIIKNINNTNNISSKFLNNGSNNVSNNGISLNKNNNGIKFDKNKLYINIKDKIEFFIKSQKFSKPTQSKLEIFLGDLHKIIINFVQGKIEQNHYNLLNNEYITNYLIYFFKINYYENIILEKLNFLNKDYKTNKKELNRILESNKNEINLLKNRLEQNSTKKTNLENKLNNLLNKNQTNKENNNNNKNLSKNELNYIEICRKANKLIAEQNNIENEINLIKDDNITFEQENKTKNLKLKNKLDEIEKKIEKLNKDVELEKIKNNEEIILLRKNISEKFNLIKNLLYKYKIKHGSNISIYNKLVEKINSSLKNTMFNNFDLIEKQNSIDYSNNYLPTDFYDNYVNQTKSYISTKPNNKFRNNFQNDFDTIPVSSQTEYGEFQRIGGLDNKTLFEKHLMNRRLKTAENRINKFEINSSINNNNNNNNNNLTSLNYNYINNSKEMNDSNEKYSVNNINNSSENSIFYHLNNASNLNNNNMTYLGYNNNTYTSHNPTLSKNFINYNKNENGNTIVYFEKNPQNYRLRGNIANNFNNNNNNYNLYDNPSSSSSKKIKLIKKNPLIEKKNTFSEKKKLAVTIQNLKNKISNTIKIPISQNEIFNRLNPLTQITFCYFRINNNNNYLEKYYPFNDIPLKNLITYPYNFSKSTIFLSKKFNKLKIISSNKKEFPNSFEINTNQISNTLVNSTIKNIIDIYREYRKFKNFNEEGSLEDFINIMMQKNENLSRNIIEKSALNKNFNFSIVLNDKNVRIEFIMCNYEDFKTWINGLAYLIKNKKEVIKY